MALDMALAAGRAYLTSDSAYGQLFAMSLFSLLPIMFFFVFFQKYLVEGIATTGLKG
jgi:multiple sugar transport system permease protein